MDKPTSGPWLAARINASSINVVPHLPHGFKAQVLGGPSSQMVAHAFGKTAEEAAANARLIAASPTMYDYVAARAAAGDAEAIQIVEAIHASR